MQFLFQLSGLHSFVSHWKREVCQTIAKILQEEVFKKDENF